MDVDDEISVELQGASCFAVEFPGYIENVDRALATMGGVEGLQEQRKSRPKTLTLKLRPEDDFCHPLVSNDVKKSSMMMLRLHTDKEPTVCTIPQVYYFRSPADLQMHSGESSLENERAFCVPPVFQVEGSVEYAIDAYGSGRETDVHTYGNAGIDAIVLEYEIPLIPNDDEGFFEDSIRAKDTRLSHVGNILRDLFKKRPVYIMEALLSELKMRCPNETLDDGDVNGQLSMLCYGFSSGPWRYSWIRKGYDPRKDTQSGKYHVISLIDENEGLHSDEDQDQKMEGSTKYSDLCCLDIGSNESTYARRIHLMDVKDEEIQRRLKKSLEEPSRICTEECGWHVEFPLSKMADRIKELVDKKGATSMSVAYYEPRDENKQYLESFQANLTAKPSRATAYDLMENEAAEFFDIIPREYYDSIAPNLVPKK